MTVSILGLSIPLWLFVLLVYVAVGIIFFIVTPYREKIVDELYGAGNQGEPAWKVFLFRLILVVIAPLIWPGLVYEWLQKENSVWDELQHNPIVKEEESLFELMSELCDEGCDADEIPEGYGEFGLELTNPIPTNTVFGETAYLAGLRLADGSDIHYERVGSEISPVSDNPVDVYTVSDTDGRQVAVLYLSPYNKRNSAKAPKGFINSRQGDP